MALPSGLHDLTACSFLADLRRLAGLPASWLTNFVDQAEEIWLDDPFLSEDEFTTAVWPASAEVGSHRE